MKAANAADPGPSFLWHDYETLGSNPRSDRPSQFACWRTSIELEALGEPESFFCRPPDDYLPEPFACLLTGLFPDELQLRGMPEPEFAAIVHERMAQAGTCNSGFNSLRFDDEVSRHLFWRNFLDPYAHEWAQGNSRFDLIDVLRLAYALRPDGMHWPQREDGAPSFRLEHMAAANALAQSRAHDATDDVIALVGLARRLRAAQPRLWEYALSLRSKAVVGALLDLEQPQPLVHVSQRFPAERGCLALVWPLMRDPQISNRFLLVDLSVDPATWADAPAEQLAERWFAAADSGVVRPPIKAVQVNRIPMLAPLSVLRGVNQTRIRLDAARCLNHLDALRQRTDLAVRVRVALSLNTSKYPDADADSALYDGFLSDSERQLCQSARRIPADQLADTQPKFSDSRMIELWWRRRARWFPASLSVAEQQRWRHEAAARLHSGSAQVRGFAQFAELMAALEGQPSAVPERIQQLARWAETRLSMFPKPLADEPLA